jgi:hypothetical protein
MEEEEGAAATPGLVLQVDPRDLGFHGSSLPSAAGGPGARAPGLYAEDLAAGDALGAP